MNDPITNSPAPEGCPAPICSGWRSVQEPPDALPGKMYSDLVVVVSTSRNVGQTRYYRARGNGDVAAFGIPNEMHPWEKIAYWMPFPNTKLSDAPRSE